MNLQDCKGLRWRYGHCLHELFTVYSAYLTKMSTVITHRISTDPHCNTVFFQDCGG